MRKDCWMSGTGRWCHSAWRSRRELAGAGHPPKSLKHYLLLMGQLNRWLETERLEPQRPLRPHWTAVFGLPTCRWPAAGADDEVVGAAARLPAATRCRATRAADRADRR